MLNAGNELKELGSVERSDARRALLSPMKLRVLAPFKGPRIVRRLRRHGCRVRFQL
jgi:hypothetical protein